eukprot:g6027.t1
MKAKAALLVLVAAFLCFVLPSCSGKRAAKDWSKMDLDDLEKQWEEGDDEEELKTEEQTKFEKLERRRKEAQAKAGSFDPSKIGSMSSAQIAAMAAGQKDIAGPTMLFAQVGSGGSGETGDKDEPLSKQETEDLGGRLQQMAQLGSLEVSVYALDAGSILVSTQKGWEGQEVLDFLLQGGGEDEGGHDPPVVPPNRMAAAMKRGGILGWGSYLTFAWAGPFLKLGSTVTLKTEHLEEIYKTHKSRFLYDNLRRNWERERARMGEDEGHRRGRRKGVTLLRALLATFKGRLALAGLLMMADSAVHIAQAIVLGRLIGYFDDDDSASWEGWTYACAVVLGGVLFSFAHHHFFFVGWTLGMQLRISTTTILYDKILRLRLSSLGQISTGHLVNLMTTDVERFQYGGTFVNYLWEAPLESLVILYFGLDQVGVSFLAGFAALALMVPTQAVFSRKFSQVRQRVTVLTDERVKLTNQAVTGARLMKINAWEPALEKEIRRVRAEEVRVLLKATLLRAVNEAMFFVQPAVVSCLVFATYHLLGNVLNPQQVFTTLALLNITQFTMGKFLYLAVQSTSESWVSIKRMETILLMEENETLMAPLREFDVAIKPHNQSPPKPAGASTAASVVTPTRTGSGSTPSPPIPNPPSGAASVPVTSTDTAATATHQAGEIVVTEERGGESGGSGTLAGERPGLVSLKQASFRWANDGEEDQHAKIFRGLMEVDAKKQKGKGGSKVVEAARLEQDGEAEATKGGLTLDAIDLSIEPGQLVGVVGPVGSSKSSLLMAVLREIAPERSAGVDAAVEGMVTPGANVEREAERDVSVQGSLAYASQEPWIQSGTLRENILFGRRMDRTRYDAVISDCALERDLSLLPSGDQTGIGDRGVNLSGGQKARVGLARMAYAHADTYLMDDPLSAVDPAVGRELFAKVVCGRLKGSTRILVTHQVHYLRDPEVDQIIVMNHGKIIGKGSYEELEASGSFAALERPTTPTSTSAEERPEPPVGTVTSGGDPAGPSRAARARSRSVSNSSTDHKDPTRSSSFSSAFNNLDGNKKSALDDLFPPGRNEEEKEEMKAGESDGVDADRGEEGAEGGEAAQNADDAETEPEPEAEDLVAAEAEKWVGGVAVDRVRSRSSMYRSEEGVQSHLHHPRSRTTSSTVAKTTGAAAGEQEMGGEGGKEVPPELVVSEDQEIGELKRSTYWEYIREAAGVWQVVLIFMSMAGGQVLVMGVTVWLARWSRQSEEEQDRRRYVIVLALLAVAAVFVSLFRAVLTFFSLVRASHRLHDRMLKRVIRAPILFFDSNPVGRILNRFTKDLHFMDDLLPMTMYDFVICSFMVAGGTLIIFFVNPWVIISMIPAVWYFLHLMSYYMKTSREAKRLEAVTRSPVYSQLSETLDGLVTIRAFGTQHRFLHQFTERVDLNTRAYFAWVYTARWLGFRMDMVVIMVLIASCFFSVAVNEYSNAVDAGLLGAALVYVIQLGGLFQWAVRQSAEVENQMVSAERVLGYCRVPQEASLESEPGRKPKDDWPAKGAIEVRDMSMRYREDLPPVLKDLTLSIKGGSRVGVVGRTGAGKSSLIAALFRLVEYDRERGAIEIDDVDISTVGLHDLRPRMSVVPQTPFLFSGSMRLNLDPFAKQSDVHMWDALEAVQMKEYVQALPGGLDAPVSEGGGNLSVGQRQLLCLARAVLQRSQVLVMDEATANIDQHTDSLIQDVVRTSFKGKTVIMVAHRLNTVIDCDQVVVLSEGSVVEAGHPHLLLQPPAGTTAATTHSANGTAVASATTADATLSSMVEETGPASAEHLRHLAREAWETHGRGEDEGGHNPPAVQPNRMAAAMEKGGIFGWASYLTFAWAGSFLKLGSMVTLKTEHLEEIYKTHKREKARMGEDEGHSRGRRKGITLLRALLATFKGRLALAGLLMMGDSAVHIAQAIVLGRLIGYFDDDDSANWEGWTHACAVVLRGVLFSFAHHHLFFVGWTLGMQLRISTTTILYDKILRLRLSSLGQISTGHLVNLMTTDVERFQYGGRFVNYLWEAPLESLVILYFGLDQVGVSFLAGFAALALMVPTQAVFSRKFSQVRQRVTVLTDERVKLTNQAVTRARLMKINAWEPALEKEIRRQEAVRAEEVRVLLKATLLKAVNEAMFFVQPAVVSCLVFATYHLLGNVLNPQQVFTTLALLNITQFTMGKFLYLAVQSTSESWVSIKRMETILLMEENETLMAPLREFDVAIKPHNQSPPKPAGASTAASVVTPTRTGSGSTPSPPIPNPPSGAASVPVTSTDTAATATHQAGEIVVTEERGGESGGSGTLAGERPGLVSLKQASFRWANDGEEDQHAKIFRGLMEVDAKKQKGKGGSKVVEAARLEQDGEAEATKGGLTLDAIDLSIEPGQLVGVVGPVGSSKSSLLMAVLREISPERSADVDAAVEGMVTAGANVEREAERDVSVQGSLAYASQEPWIQSGTLRENILFGRRMDRTRYDAVISDCALERDLSLLPSGDQTGIGDRGVNLSGGQKARVGLARMAYAHADTYLMDDPLSAVDPAVGRELFAKVVCGRLKGSTRILVTHQVHYLRDPEVDQIIVMNHGKIIGKGSYEELEASGSFAALERPTTPTSTSAEERPEPPVGTVTSGGDPAGPSRAARARSRSVSNSSTDHKDPTRSSSFSSAFNNLDGNKKSALDDLFPPGRNEEEKEEMKAGESDGVDADRGEEGAEGGEAAQNADDAETEPEPEAEDLVAAEAEKWVGGVAVDRVRSRSSMYRSEEGVQSHLHHPRSRTTSSTVAKTTGAAAGEQEMGGEGGKEVPPELVVSEDQEIGELKRSTYWEYIREAAGVWQVVLIFMSMAGGQVLVMGVTVWLARWSRQSEEEQDRKRYVIVLALLAVAAVFVSLFRAVLTFFSLVRASHRLHDRMLKRVIRAPILFFDSNPVGRILNRFTKDLHFMDDLLPMTMYDFVICSFMVAGGTLIIFFVNPWVIISMIPAVWYFLHLMSYYMKTSREAKRLEAVTRSPVYSQLSETLDGLVTIRAFGTQHRFLHQFTERVDLNTRAYFAWVYTARWLGFRMDMVVIMVLIASCFFSVAVNEYSNAVDAGLLGAALVYVIQLGGLFQWAVRQSAEVENQMVSAERVLGYCRVPQEASLESEPGRKPKDDWPAKGAIEVRDMSMRYREDLPPVLKDLTLSIKGGSRVGVVGRTGAGKSSLIAALFRLVEYDRERGAIEIDDVDISTVGLHDLRPRMSVVPQTPFLFSGSMRLNLDPFAKQSDVHMWDALEAVQMKEYVQALPGGLDAPVSEGGGNLSVGQRQLLCLARAVLQRSQVLVMDEATANIDQHTDSLIQDVVRTSFKGKTVIMVAHRLNTVIDCDQVVVLSEGSVVEAGHPHLLLQPPAGTTAATTHSANGTAVASATTADATLSSMVEETGPASAEHLRHLAREAWETSERAQA